GSTGGRSGFGWDTTPRALVAATVRSNNIQWDSAKSGSWFGPFRSTNGSRAKTPRYRLYCRVSITISCEFASNMRTHKYVGNPGTINSPQLASEVHWRQGESCEPLNT